MSMEWKTAWSYLPINYNACIGTVENCTQRTFFRNNLSGNKIKIKFSNLYSNQPLLFENVVLAKKGRGKEEITEFKTVTYQGREQIVLEAGKEFSSDEINFSINDNEDMVLSVYIKEKAEIFSTCSTWAAKSWHTHYGFNGNFCREQNFAEAAGFEVYTGLRRSENEPNNLFGITAIQVYTNSNVKTVALFGDSITHMSYYSDALMEKLYAFYPKMITVVNRGIGGNRLLHDYSRVPEFPGGGTVFGNAGVNRFYSDIYGSDQPEYVLVLIGINDFTHPYTLNHPEETVTFDEYRQGIEKLVQIAHENGSKIFLGTITPFRFEENNWFTLAEELRQQANEWIRSQTIADGIVDFDKALRADHSPEHMQDGCHLGDGLHPNTAGGTKMADVIPVGWFQ